LSRDAAEQAALLRRCTPNPFASDSECSEGHHTDLWVQSADVPEKGPVVTTFIGGEKRWPGTEVLDPALQIQRKA
jgi:hypothetical protein